MPSKLMNPLSDEEIEELEQFLLSEFVSEETMLLDMLDGYLTAIVIGPTTILPSEWLPRIWGPSEDDAPEYESVEQAQRILELIMRHMNGIVWTLQDNPDAFDPLLNSMTYAGDPREYLDGEMWAHGFMDGIELCREDWQPLFDDPAAKESMRPIHLLGTRDPTEEEKRLIRWPAEREVLTKQIAGSVAALYRFWLPHREAMRDSRAPATVRREGPKVGRNDLCPCGSGKKFKKCCGAAPTLH